MKTRISATIDESTLKLIETIFKKSHYRNKSHLIEEALKYFDKKEGYNEK